MTRAQKQVLRDRVLRNWPHTFSSVSLLSGDNFDPKMIGKVWRATGADRRKVLDEMVAEGLIEVVGNGTPETRDTAGSLRMYRVLEPGVWGGDEVLCHNPLCHRKEPHRDSLLHRQVIEMEEQTEP